MQEILDEIDEIELDLEIAEANDEDEEYINILQTQLSHLEYKRDNLNISSI